MAKERKGWKQLVDIADSVREVQSKRFRSSLGVGKLGENARFVLDKTVLGLFSLGL